MSSHVHDCPTEGCNGYWECLADPCDEEQKSPCHECLRAEVKNVKESLDRAKWACNAYYHDLARIGSLCEQTADEYPLKAVERTVRQFAEVIKQRDFIKAEVERLRAKIDDAPCLVARDGETTYECRADNLCRVCKWRTS